MHSFLPNWMLIMPTLIARDFMFQIPWDLLQMKQDELFQELLKSKPAENMGQVPAESYLLRCVPHHHSNTSARWAMKFATSNVACYAPLFLYY